MSNEATNSSRDDGHGAGLPGCGGGSGFRFPGDRALAAGPHDVDGHQYRTPREIAERFASSDYLLASARRFADLMRKHRENMPEPHYVKGTLNTWARREYGTYYGKP